MKRGLQPQQTGQERGGAEPLRVVVTPTRFEPLSGADRFIVDHRLAGPSQDVESRAQVANRGPSAVARRPRKVHGDEVAAGMEIRISASPKRDGHMGRYLPAQRLQIRPLLHRLRLRLVVGFVGDLDDGVRMPGGDLAHAAHVSVDVHRIRCRVGQRDDFDVQAVMPGAGEEAVERREAPGGRQHEEMLRHDEHADDGDLLPRRPAKVRVDLTRTTGGFHLEKPEGRDATPYERAPIRANEARTRNLEVPGCQLRERQARARPRERQGNRRDCGDQTSCATGVSL